jgi:hypothetical protein
LLESRGHERRISAGVSIVPFRAVALTDAVAVVVVAVVGGIV